MNQQLEALLEHLHGALDEDRQLEIEELHRRTLNWEQVERLPVVMSYPVCEDFPFQPYPHSAIFNDPEKMLFNELLHAFNTSVSLRRELNDDLPCTVRANFGTVIIASMFGANIQQVGENPPWVVAADSREISLEAIADQDPSDLSGGWFPRVVETYEAYRNVLSLWPEFRRTIYTVLPDLQGPFDNLELIAGSGVFAELYAEPDRVAQALETVAAAQIAAARYLTRFINDDTDGFSHQHATVIKGHILLRNDSSILMSPEMYQRQIAIHDERVMRAMRGGGVHSCGNVGTHAEAFLDLDGIGCLDLGQPELNDIDRIYALARVKRIPLVRISVPEEDLVTGKVLDRFPTGATLLHGARSLNDADRIMTAYCREAENRRKRRMAEQPGPPLLG
jgi:hypothetical protein